MLFPKRTLVSTLVTAVLSGTAMARDDLPNYHALADESLAVSQSQSKTQNPLQAKAGKSMEAIARKAVARQLVSGAEAIQFNKQLGVPSFVWANPSLPKASVAALKPDLQAKAAAEDYLRKYAPLYNLDSKTLSGAQLKSVHDTGEGAIITKYTQRVGGIEVFGQELNVAMKRDHSLVALSGHLSPHAATLEKSGAAAKLEREFALSGADAIAKAFADMGGKLSAADLQVKATQGDYTLFEGKAAEGDYELTGPSRAKQVLFNTRDGLVPAYYVEVEAGNKHRTDGDSFGFVISAQTGKVLFRKNHTEDAAFGYRVFADTDGINLPWDGPQGKDGQPNPLGTFGYVPTFKAPQMVKLEHGPISTGDPWLLPIASDTNGNNVDSYADLAAPNGYFRLFGDFRADVNANAPGGGLAFDYTLNPAIPANANATQVRAAVTQMFYLNNWLHDWFYDSGFNEAAGNAQASNFGRGGVEGDPIRSEAQDFGGSNNANMSTPADGFAPRMQMYVFNHEGDATIATSAGTFPVQKASFGPQTYNIAGPKDIVRYVDANGTTDIGCTAASNGAALAGKIALISRGSCAFTLKVKNAQNAGAIAAIVYNNAATGLPGMGGTDASITIPSQGITLADGTTLKTAIAGGGATVTTMSSVVKPSRDSSVDALIMAHEWGHYISNRLVVNSSGLSNNQGRSMGEGWGDFHAILMTVEEADKNVALNAGFGGVYAQGGYADMGPLDPVAGNTTFYFGIRRVPYTVDTSKNALTFKHIQNGVELPLTHPVAGGTSGANNSEVHNAGEIWATMLWECYVKLLNDSRYSFDQAREKMKRYLVAGYKLTPAAPTYVEARDAILAAAKADDAANYLAFVDAFAKRGLGAGAVAPDRFDSEHSGVVESFTKGAAIAAEGIALEVLDSTVGDRDGFLDVGEKVKIKLSARNSGFQKLTGLKATVSSTASVSFANDGKVTFPDLEPGARAEASVEMTLNSATQSEIVAVDVAYAATNSDNTASDDAGLLTNFDLVPDSTSDDGNKGLSDWAFRRLIDGGEPWMLSNEIWGDPADYAYWGLDNDSESDIVMESPALVVGSDDKLRLSWVQLFRFEKSGTTNWDGGVVEYSVDGGAWVDAGSALAPAYGGVINGGGTTIEGRNAYVGASAGFPGIQTAVLDLTGKGLAGKSVKVRFRVASDGGVGDIGWIIDDIDVQGITNKPFTKIAEDASNPPVAKAGADQSVKGTDTVNVDASASTDTENNIAGYQWTQLSGAAVTLTGASTAKASFKAPNATGPLSFRVTVTDTTGFSATDDLVVNVTARALPVANAGADLSVNGGSTVSVSGSGSSHPEGASFTYAWTQVSGPAVTLTNANAAVVGFTAPDAGGTIVLKLTTTDSFGLKSEDTVTIAVAAKVHSGGGGGGSFGWLGLALLPLALRRRQR